MLKIIMVLRCEFLLLKKSSVEMRKNLITYYFCYTGKRNLIHIFLVLWTVFLCNFNTNNCAIVLEYDFNAHSQSTIIILIIIIIITVFADNNFLN